MSEKYKPSLAEDIDAEKMMNEKQKEMSDKRHKLHYKIMNPELIKDCDLRAIWEHEGNDLKITGKIKGHEVVLKRFSVAGGPSFSGEIDGKNLEREDAEKLVKKYEAIAHLQTLDVTQSNELKTDSGQASMLAAELLK
ncbi:MAG TPA: hypothetical protein VJJ27_01375 [Candidatus Paceibacterota bacterium]